MKKIKYVMLIGIVLGYVGALVLLSSCGDAGGRAKDNNPVMLIITGISPSLVTSDVVDEDVDAGVYSIVADTVNVGLEIRQLDPDGGDFAGEGTYISVMIEEYHVEFERTDTGSAVPAPFSNDLSVFIEPGGGQEGGEEGALITCEVVRADQKLMPPLIYLNPYRSYGYEPDTGLEIIHGTIHITVIGKTIAGRRISVSGSVPVEFANWAESL